VAEAEKLVDANISDKLRSSSDPRVIIDKVPSIQIAKYSCPSSGDGKIPEKIINFEIPKTFRVNWMRLKFSAPFLKR
ncbi:MAG: hypothetical protein ABIF92_01400, partial [archaeon]